MISGNRTVPAMTGEISLVEYESMHVDALRQALLRRESEVLLNFLFRDLDVDALGAADGVPVDDFLTTLRQMFSDKIDSLASQVGRR